MGIMTMTKSDSSSNAAVVCEKKCEVKLERLNPDQQVMLNFDSLLANFTHFLSYRISSKILLLSGL